MSSLYELTTEIQSLVWKYNEAETQEQLDEISKHLDALAMPFKQKVVAVSKYVIDVESDATAIKNEIERLKARLKKRENEAEWYRTYISNSMQYTDTKEIEMNGVRLSFRKSSRVEVTDETLVPDLYKREKIVKTVDKEAIKEAWKSGVGVAGTTVIENKSLQIK